MRRMVEKLLAQYGREVVADGHAVRALFQPVTGRLERLAEVEPGPLGRESRGRWVYIGPVEPQLREDGALTVAGKDYRIRTVQLIDGNDGPAYCWAMCVEKGREDRWGTDC